MPNNFDNVSHVLGGEVADTGQLCAAYVAAGSLDFAAAAQTLGTLGEFRLAGRDVQVRDDDGRLIVQATSQPAIELLLDARGDVYPSSSFTARGTPLIEDDGVNRIAWRQGGSLEEAVRKGTTQPLTATNPEWRDSADEHWLSPQFSLRIFERAGRR